MITTHRNASPFSGRTARLLGLIALLLSACGDDSANMAEADAAAPNRPTEGPVTPDAGPARPVLAVTTDFLNGTLSVIDIDRLQAGASREDALVGTVDLGDYAPAPMSLAITPDGKTAIVSISSGFLRLFLTTPPGDGSLVFVDLETLEVTDQLDIGAGPMGIVVSPDGKRAFVGLFDENYFAVVDLENKSFEAVETGAAYNEELSIDDSGEVAILTFGPTGNVKTFALDDPTGLGQTTGLTGDAAGVAFFPGTKLAYLVQAPTTFTNGVGGYDVIDVSDPNAPVSVDAARIDAHPDAYPVTTVAARGSIAYPVTADGVVTLVEKKLEGKKAVEVQRIKVGDGEAVAYGLGATADGRVLVAVPREHYIGVVDLQAGTAFTVPWELDMFGPTEIKVVPTSAAK